MTTRQSHKRRGKSFETDLMKWFRDKGYEADRLALAGSLDEGDVIVKFSNGSALVIEAKAPARDGKINLSGWLKEAETEVSNYAKARDMDISLLKYVVVIKATGKSLDEAYVVSKLKDNF